MADDRKTKDGCGSADMMQFLSQMMKLPITAFVYSMDMFAKTLYGIQKLAEESIDAMLGNRVQAPGDTADPGRGLTSDAMASGITQTLGDAPGSRSNLTSNTTSSLTSGTSRESAETTDKEAGKMRDTDLSDHTMLKLVRYKVLFIKRKFEVAFPEKEELISDDTTDTAYTAWKIAQFIQNLDTAKVPSLWGGGENQQEPPKYPPAAEYKKGWWRIFKLPEDDKKFLRVYFEVLDRYPREKLHKEERQIEVLEQIRDNLAKS